MVKLSDFSPFWLCVPAFQQVCQTLLDLLVKSVQALSRRKRGRKNFRFDRINEKDLLTLSYLYSITNFP